MLVSFLGYFKQTRPVSSNDWHISDKYHVDVIFDLFSVMLKLILGCGVIFIGLTFLKSKKFLNAKNDIQNLQARLSQLRLALKGKIKRKSNVFRAGIKANIVEGDIYDSTLKSLVEVKFESSEDFQNYFDISKQLVKMVQVSNDGENVPSHVAENNYMSSDFKTEMDIIRLIKEMSDLSNKINSRVEEHNRTSTQKLQRVDSLVFPSITEVNKVFKGDDDFTTTSLSDSAVKSTTKAS
jgi:hypothetical protein